MRTSISAATSAVILLTAVFFLAMTAAYSTNFDFRAFYCAGAALRAHADPYQTEPLHTCERTQTDQRFSLFVRDVTLPAPQPGYDIAGFAVLSLFPFKVASRIWIVLLLASMFVAILATLRLSQTPFVVVLAAFWLSLGIASIYLGELIPICVAAICVSAFAAQRCAWNVAGIAAAASLVEPHLGIPICITLALWAPRARLALGIAVLALVTISFAALGLERNVEYVTAVLPAHALSEIGSDAQLSLSAVLHALGLSDGVALRIGTLSYIALTVAATFLARSLRARFADNAFLVAVPAALSVIGGVFMHVTEIVLAIPLLLLLLKQPAIQRIPLVIALALLAVPWWSLATPMLLGASTGTLLAAVTVAYLVWYYSNANAGVALLAGIATAFSVTALLQWHHVMSPPHSLVHPPLAVVSSKYPETGWAWFNLVYMSTGSAPTWLLRSLTWIGLLLVASASYAIAAPKRRIARAST